MKIVIFEPKFLTPKHYSISPLVFSKNLARTLARQGDEVSVLSQGIKQTEVRDGYTIYPLGGEIVPFHRFFPQMLESIPNTLPFFSPRLVSTAARILKEEIRPDVIYTAGTVFPAVFTTLLQRKTGIPAVYHVFFMPSQRWWRSATIKGYRTPPVYAARQAVKNAVHELIKPNIAARWGLRHVTGVIASSNYLRERLGRFGLDKHGIAVVYPGVDLPPRNSTPPTSNPTIVYLGHLWQGRGVLDLAEAFAQVHRNLPEAKLMVAPTDINTLTKKYFLEIVKKHNMADSIVWKSIVSDVYTELLQPASVVALPYHNDASIKLIEAMAAAKTVVTTDIDWIPEIITDGMNGYIVRPGNSNELAGKLETALRNPDLSAAMGEKARATATEKCSLDTAANAIRRILQDTLVRG